MTRKEVMSAIRDLFNEAGLNTVYALCPDPDEPGQSWTALEPGGRHLGHNACDQVKGSPGGRRGVDPVGCVHRGGLHPVGAHG